MDWANFGQVDWNAGGFQLQTGNGFTNNGIFNANATSAITSVNAGTETFTNAAAGTMNINTDTSITPDLFLQSGIFNLSGGDVTAAPIDNNGTINGTGVITGDIVNQSTVQPGGPGTIGTLTINGNFTNSTGGIVVIDILDNVQAAGTGYDWLDVVGQADLGETLVLSSAGGYTVANNDSFTPITFGSRTANNFATIVDIGGEIVTPTYTGDLVTAGDLTIQLNLALTFNWDDGGGDGLWNTAANWSSNIVPGIGDDASIGIFSVTIAAAADANTLSLAAGGSLSISGGGTLTLANDSTLDGGVGLTGGMIDLTGMSLTLNGNLAWFASATIQSDGSGVLNLASTAALSGSAIYTLSNVTVNNSGSFSLTAGIATGFRLEDSAIFNNSGTFTINNDSNIFDASGSPGTFNNSGTIRKAGGAGTSTIGSGIAYTHSAANIDIQTGTLVLGAGPVTLDSGSILTGTGTLGNTLNNNGGIVDPGGQSTIGTLTINGDYNQDATGNLVIEIASNGGGTPVAGVDNDFLVVTGNTSVLGTLTLLDILGYTVTGGDTFNVMNVAGTPSGAFGTIISIGAAIATPTYAANDLFIDLTFSGLFTWTGAIDDAWNNAGNWDQGIPGIGNDASIPNGSGFSVDIASAADASTLALGADATLNLVGGTLTLANNSTLDGGVNLVNGGFDLSGSTLTLNSGLNWSDTSSIANGTLILPASGPLLISGGVTNTLDNITVNINSNTTYSAGNLTLANGSVVNTNAVFDFAGDVGIAGSASSFNASNNSTVVKSVGTGTSAILASVTSSVNGSVDVQTGNLNLNLALLDLGAGDVFSGAGNYVGNVTNNGGTIRPGGAGSVGTLTVSGDYVNNSGTLEIDISSNVAFDQFIVTNATFGGGSIDINHLASYIPTVGLQQPVIVCGVSCAGSFGAINAPVGIVYGQTTNATNLTLDVISVNFAWDGGGDGISWTDDLNWSLDVAPDNTIDVVLPGISVQVNAAGAQANNLTINGTLSILGGGDLTINDFTANPGSNLTIAGGTLVTNGVVQIDGAFNLNGGTLNLVAGGTLMNLNNNWRDGTITGGAPLTLGGPPGATTLDLSGPADKTLDAITLIMNMNDINMSGAGDLILQAGAIISNLGGMSFNHLSGNGGIIAGSGGGQFDNADGSYNHFGGNSVINVEFTNNVNSVVNVLGGRLVMQDAEAADAATYIVGGGAILQVDSTRTFTNVVSSSGTVHVSGANTTTMALAAGQFVTNGLVVDAAATLAGDPVTVLSGFLWDGGALPGQLTMASGSRMSITALNATLPAISNINGDVILNNPSGTNVDLNGNLLQLNNAILSGVGSVTGSVDNNSGVVVAGGAANTDILTITGNYSQGTGSALVVEVFNNGFTTVSDQLIVGGATNLNGGALVIGFKTSSLGLVTSSFAPLVSSTVSGNFSRIFDAGGNILFINFNAGVFTVLGTTPKIPDKVIDDLIGFAEKGDKFAEKVANNKSEAEQVMEELLNAEERERGSLVCN